MESSTSSSRSGARSQRALQQRLGRIDDYFARVEQAIPWTENNPLDGRP